MPTLPRSRTGAPTSRPTLRHGPPRPGTPGRSVAVLALAAVTALPGAGCAMNPPAPWQKGHLARPDMAMTPDPLQARLQQKVYASKENAAGGAAIGGGGCGCN